MSWNCGPKEAKFNCWNCGSSLVLENLGNTCPSCMASLTTADYDIVAQDLLEELKIAKYEAESRNSEVKKCKRCLRYFERDSRLRYFLTRIMLKADLASLSRKHNTAMRKVNQKKEQIREHAYARYYSSLWFKETGIQIVKPSEVSAQFIRASYQKNGCHRVTPKNTTDARGLFGEYAVFDLLASAIESGDISEATLLPSLVVPSPYASGPGGIDVDACEIDVVLITRKGIYVIESKNLYGSIECVFRKKTREYKVYNHPGHNGKLADVPRKEDRTIQQNSKHILALRKALGQFEGPVYNVVAYIDHFGFQAPSKQGVDNVFLASVGGSGESDILNTILEIEESSTSVRSYLEVMQLDSIIREKYLDKGGEKKASHIAQLKRMDNICVVGAA